MVLESSSKNIFMPIKPREVTKNELIQFIRDAAAKGGEVSWITTEVKSFGWEDININEKAFIYQLGSLGFNSAFVGVFYPKEKRTAYTAFKLSTKSKL